MLRIIISVILVYFFVVIGMYLMQRHFLYQPDRSAPDSRNWALPASEIIHYETQDGLALTSWYQPAETGQPTLVYFQGNSGNMGDRVASVKPFLDQGYGVLLLAYRGYGGNPGKPTQEGLYNDARAGLNYLNAQGISNDCIVFYGESLGCAVAIQMALEYAVGAVVLQAPFNRLSELASYHYPLLPVKWLLKDKFDSQSKAPHIQEPVLLMHGTEDKVVPQKFGKRLFGAIASPRAYVVYEGASHNNLDPYATAKATMAFLEKHLRCAKG